MRIDPREALLSVREFPDSCTPKTAVVPLSKKHGGAEASWHDGVDIRWLLASVISLHSRRECVECRSKEGGIRFKARAVKHEKGEDV